MLEDAQRLWLDYKDYKWEKTETARISEDAIELAYEALDLVESLSAHVERLHNEIDVLQGGREE